MVFKSGLVTRLRAYHHDCPQISVSMHNLLEKDNINSITSILFRGPTPLLSPLSRWKYWFHTLHLQFFPSIIYSNSNSHFKTELRLGSADSFMNHDFFWLSNTQNMTQFSFSFKLIVFSFYTTLKLQLFWNNQAIHTPGLQYPLFDHDTGSRHKHRSLLAISILSYS